ncbi:SDR family NAD(P)-dependent oxidoreductase [Actinorugispora endophytica]|uniref:Protochlorophyllide reductase n=1 Tax=Actinorugispora endophytica TaxID=1605990 RepID=A0A4R6UZE9_9ACTN|nr:SDR family NAD(P)-dependent oxidoreductase [Actinorugispora endophytica]TDQ51509.1 protochlorophyllide reductase [Actinorugispora endophytica]
MPPTKSVVITGASSGLGLHVAVELARADWHVVLGCRAPERGAAAAALIRERSPAASLEVLEMDLASLDSVRAAASALATGGRPPLHALVSNAGVQVANGVRRSADGHELTFATNHLGHFLLIRLLLDHVAEPGRVVLVSSGTHMGPRHSFGFPAPVWADPALLADPDHSPMDATGRGGRQRYATSKLANLYTTYELARRLGERRITANAFDPGLMPLTGLSRDYPTRIRRVYEALGAFSPLILTFPGSRRRPRPRKGQDQRGGHHGGGSASGLRNRKADDPVGSVLTAHGVVRLMWQV